MRLILQYITFAEYQAITAMNTKEEIDSLIWCVEHMPEQLRSTYLRAFLGGPVTQELDDFFYSRGQYAPHAAQEVAA
jgi:hypothetical protein